MHQHDWSKPSVGPADALPLEGFLQAHILLVQLLWLLCHLLGWVPSLVYLGVSSGCYTTISLTTFVLCSIVPSRTLSLLASIPNAFSTILLPLEILQFAILCSLWVVFCWRVYQTMTSRRRHHHPAKNSANLGFPPPGVQVQENPRYRPWSFFQLAAVKYLCVWWRSTWPNIYPEESVVCIEQG